MSIIDPRRVVVLHETHINKNKNVLVADMNRSSGRGFGLSSVAFIVAVMAVSAWFTTATANEQVSVSHVVEK